MKKPLLVLAAVLLALPLTVGSVTWQMDSNQFQWPATSVKRPGPDQSVTLSLACKPDAAGGIVKISYALPTGVKNATLRIYGVSGALVKDFRLRSGSAAIHWDIGADRVAPGVYVALLRCGTLENKQPIAIIN
ncbi:MAG: hypothetical protein JXA71_17810 [Chitinispirillaceae bacterium]|nr:hypothetical protein [Chitinispirillaceae bacterium]